jgi:signal transduction histidine kinase
MNDDQRAATNLGENTQNTSFLMFAVEDTVKGMSESDLKQLFKRFKQVCVSD